MLWLLRVTCRVKVALQNIDLPEKGAIIACKHQSMLEILILLSCVKRPVFFLKSSLLYIPFMNLYLLRTGQLGVRRWRGKNSNLLNLAIERLKDSNVINFPEGTRVDPDKEVPYHSGVVVLAKKANLPIVPMCTNAGNGWPRRTIVKKSGEVVLKQLPLLYLDGSIKETLSKLQKDINTCSREL